MCFIWGMPYSNSPDIKHVPYIGQEGKVLTIYLRTAVHEASERNVILLSIYCMSARYCTARDHRGGCTEPPEIFLSLACWV